MKHGLVALLTILTVAITAFSTANKEYEVFVQSGVFVQDPDKQFLGEFKNSKSLVIDHVSSKGYELYGPTGFEKMLDAKKISYKRLEIPMDPLDPMADYPTYAQITKGLQDLQAKYPSIMTLTSLGKSHRGRDLWMVKISDNVQSDEIEPEVKFVSSMHGDEITGRELMMRLIDDLGKGYGVNQEITTLINNTEVYIMPSMNPDGSEARTRYNGRGLDLNRNFPDFSVLSNTNIAEGREPETQAMMKFEVAHHFSMSANFHTGAEVVNYVWDTAHVRHPQDSLARKISLDYASRVPYMANSTEFQNGITNGYDWYEVNGGMQDYTTYWYNDLHFTVELSGEKWPQYSTIDGYYRDNKVALLAFLQTVHQGAGFKINEANQVGLVEVIHLKAQPISLGKFPFWNSEFFKVLEPGKYRFVVKAVSGRSAEFETTVGLLQAIPNNGNYMNISLGNIVP
ncbi:MAG: M14 family zinc carboxypeptidase [Oligoflexia bacterium]|nr:M14 family zinc carboxypeptidase [Oligoflexia bacterium]